MFAWLKLLVRAHALPDAEPERVGRVRVDFIGTVLSPNTCASPITDWNAALLEIVLVDLEHVQDRQGDHELYTPLGVVRYGNGLVVADAHGRELYIESATVPCIIPLSIRPMVLDAPVPPELAHAARLSRHMLSYRETRFREGDRVRVVATVTGGQIAPQAGVMRGFSGGGYRDGRARVLVPADGERLELHELL
jgi:hypothetical protein